MPATRNRAEQYKRQIVGVLMDTTNNHSTAGGGDGSHHDGGGIGGGSGFAAKVDGTDKTHVSMMIQDLRNGLDKKLDSIKTDMLTCKQEQLETHRSGMMKIPKSTREMTIQEFNQKYNCNLLDLLQTVKSNASSGTATDMMGATINNNKRIMIPAPVCGKRDRQLETPAPYRGNRAMQTPGTLLRTVRRGEKLYSRNGSPVEPVDEGALVATVTKKRRGNAAPGAAANFDINVGDGRYISLNDPGGVKHLDDNMKSNALTQLKVLQDQMACLMEQLTTKETKSK